MNLFDKIKPTKKREAVSDLVSDINGMRVMIMRLENQILRNEAMIENMLAMHEDEKPEKPAEVWVAPVEPVIVKPSHSVPVSEMLEEILKPPFSNATFTYGSLVQRIISHYPEADYKTVKQGIYPAIARIKARIIKNEDGTMKLKV